MKYSWREYAIELFTDLWLIACVVMNLVIFLTIAITGQATIIEDNTVILWLEIGLNIPVILAAIYSTVKDIKYTKHTGLVRKKL